MKEEKCRITIGQDGGRDEGLRKNEKWWWS